MQPIYLASLFGVSLLLCHCASQDKPRYTISVHSLGSDMESPRSNVPDLIGNPPQRVILKRAPEFTQKNVAAFHAFPAENGNEYGVAVKLDFKGTQALELVTRMEQGGILRSVVNGRGVDVVTIDRPITDGIFTIWEGVPESVIKEMEKNLPSIAGLRSASNNVDMTPTTRTEKKKAMSFFRKSKEQDAKKDKEENLLNPSSSSMPALLDQGIHVPAVGADSVPDLP